MNTLKLAALAALLISACDPPEALPAPKEATAAPLPPPVATTPPPAPGPVTEVPATSKNPDAVAAYRLAFDLWTNGRGDEARAAVKKALSLDPDFVSAAALQGDLTPGPDGNPLIAAAIAKANGLSENEVLLLRVFEADHTDDAAKYAQLTKQLAAALPAAYGPQYLYATSQWWQGHYDVAKAAYQKAIDLNPNASAALNDLGALELYLGDVDAAVAHLQKSLVVRPSEPNPQDSLAEAYLLQGKLDEAEKGFQKALEIQPKFLVAWTGIALTAFYRGDFKKGYESLAKYRDAPDAPLANRGNAYRIAAWAQLAQNKPADALKTIDAWEAEATKAKDTAAGINASLVRIDILVDSASYDAALKVSAGLVDRIAKSNAADLTKGLWTANRLTNESVIYARTKKPAEAEKARAALKEIADRQDNVDTSVRATIATGEAAIAKGDTTAAIAAFGTCPLYIDYCTWERMKLEPKAQSAATKDQLLTHRRRFGESFFIWTKVGPPKK